MTIATKLGDRLGALSSRRTFLRLASGSALGTGLVLSGADVALADTLAPCYGCGGGTDCFSPAPVCSNCPDGCSGGACPFGWSISGSWTICNSLGCKVRCLECCKGGSVAIVSRPFPMRV